MPIQIAQRYLDEMVAHAREEAPNECCGVLLGAGSRALSLRRCTNVEHSPFRYTMDPRDLIEVDRLSRQNDWELLVIYHSHLGSPAYPSPTDVRLAQQSGYEATYVLVSLQNPAEPVVRAYSIDLERRSDDHRDSVTEVPIDPPGADGVDELAR